MQCSQCGLQLALDDNFCRRCGAATNIIDVPAVRSEARPLTLWQNAKPAVARGVVLIAAGAMLRFVVGRAGRALVSRALSDDSDALRRLMPFRADHGSKDGGDELEILWYRRVRR